MAKITYEAIAHVDMRNGQIMNVSSPFTSTGETMTREFVVDICDKLNPDPALVKGRFKKRCIPVQIVVDGSDL